MARKASALAQRRERDHANLTQAAQGDSTLCCSMPSYIEADIKLRDMWELVVGERGIRFNPEDTSLLTQLVTNYVMLNDLNAQIYKEDGTITFLVEEDTPYGSKLVENPAIKIRDKLIQESIKLANTLGLTPDARLKFGLTQSQTNAINVSIADTIYKALREADV